MSGLPPFGFLPPGHPAWAQAMMVQQQAQLAAQAQAMAQAQAAQAAMARQVNPQAAAAPSGKNIYKVYNLEFFMFRQNIMLKSSKFGAFSKKTSKRSVEKKKRNCFRFFREMT